ncbi:MAG TPA: fumarate reductase subunit FrdD [Thermodesulfobacteriota bacterium]|nr:fumarate reductase subunit FrdD [Thermodesulfobacteriota bacterium]
MATRKTSEPLWWGLFAAGGVVAAFLVPVHLLVHGLALPLGWIAADPEGLRAFARHPLVKLYLFVLIALPFFHWAHRFRFVLYDVGLHGGRALIAVLCYGAAIAATVVTVGVLWRL